MYTKPYLSLKYLCMCVYILRKNNMNTYEMLSLCEGIIKYFLLLYTFFYTDKILPLIKKNNKINFVLKNKIEI